MKNLLLEIKKEVDLNWNTEASLKEGACLFLVCINLILTPCCQIHKIFEGRVFFYNLVDRKINYSREGESI